MLVSNIDLCVEPTVISFIYHLSSITPNQFLIVGQSIIILIRPSIELLYCQVIVVPIIWAIVLLLLLCQVIVLYTVTVQR